MSVALKEQYESGRNSGGYNQIEDCSACCSARAPIKCECLAAHYCSAACKDHDLDSHRRECTSYLLQVITTKRQALTRLSTLICNQNSDDVLAIAKAQTELAKRYHQVGELLQNGAKNGAHCNWSASEENYKQALSLWRQLESTPQWLESTPQWQLFEELVFDPCDAIRSRIGLGILYCQCARYDDALTVLEEGLIRAEKVGEFTMDLYRLRATLADILACKGRVYMRKHSNEEALHLLERALHTNRFLTSVSLVCI